MKADTYKIFIIFFSVFLFSYGAANAQQVGLSFSYFLPKNGDFSVPVTPLSYRGLGFNINKFIRPETGITLYRMSGLAATGLPFDSKNAIFGPMFSIMVPVDIVLEVPVGNAEFRLKGGVFGFYNFGVKLNEGNFDRALRDYLDFQVLNADMQFDNQPGYGYRGGAEIILNFSKKFALTMEGMYHVGGAKYALQGDYSGVHAGSSTIQSGSVSYPDTRIDFTGMEISLGVLFTP
ncbi:MAG: hypothetical protein ACFCUU_15315 [Cyclobacteriaceae bacterium]